MPTSAVRFFTVDRSQPRLFAEAAHVASFLDSKSLARISALSRSPCQSDCLVAALLNALATQADGIAEVRVSRLLHLSEGAGSAAAGQTPETVPGVKLDFLIPLGSLRRGELHSWLGVLNELEAWDDLRRAGLRLGHDDSGDSGGELQAQWHLPANQVIMSHINSIRIAEDLCIGSFPSRSLYYSRATDFEAAAPLFSWRSRLVIWANSCAVHFALPTTVVADSVGLADRFVVAHFDILTRSGLQLVFITALCIAARRRDSDSDALSASNFIETLYRAATTAEYSECAIESMAVAMAAFAEEDAVGQRACLTLGGTGCASLPAGPPGIISRIGLYPFGGVSFRALPHIEVVVQTTPTAFADHLLGLLPVGWMPGVVAPLHSALLIAMTASGAGSSRNSSSPRAVPPRSACASPPIITPCSPQHIAIHRYSPATIAISCLVLALRVVGLAAHPTATAWLSLVERSLHVDLDSVHACTEQLLRLAEPGSALALQALLPRRA